MPASTGVAMTSAELGICRTILPNDVAKRCVDLVAQCGLTYGAIDLILTPDGRYVFLELNSAGEYGWIEEMSGLPISEAIADFLMAGQSLPRAVAHA